MILIPPGFDYLGFFSELMGFASPFLLIGFTFCAYRMFRKASKSL